MKRLKLFEDYEQDITVTPEMIEEQKLKGKAKKFNL